MCLSVNVVDRMDASYLPIPSPTSTSFFSNPQALDVHCSTEAHPMPIFHDAA
jgi:hypothetical protein